MSCRFLAGCLVLGALMLASPGAGWAADVSVGGEVVFRLDDAAQADEINRRIDKGLELFAKYFRYLWT